LITRAFRSALCASAVALACAAPAARAETLYVIEQLVVSVHAAPDGSGDRVAQIQSGERVELLERQGDQARVRVDSGAEGWVRASYLSGNPPLRDQLKTRTEELERVQADNLRLESELAAARQAASDTTAAADTAKPAPVAPEGPAPRLPLDARPAPVAVESARASDAPLFQSRPIVPSRPTWLVALGFSFVTLVTGFALGWRVLDRRIRAKYGGLRIY